jgi:kynurenine formamidase
MREYAGRNQENGPDYRFEQCHGSRASERPVLMIPEIEYWDHRRGAEHMKTFFPDADEEALPSGLGWAIEFVHLSTHSGTHLDAPWHYHPTANRGESARTIDQIPLEWCFSDGVVLDLSDKPDGYLVTPSDLEDALARVGYRLKPFDLVLVSTGADQHWGSARYLEYCLMEKLTNLDKLSPHGFQVACFPVKILKASAGWVRAVAILR